MNKLITILGPTACGKTALAVRVACAIDGEIISADSRQVYRRMDIGTGKDLEEYSHNGQNIAYHLIDILDAGCQYNLFEYQEACRKAIVDITARERTPVLCGGTGLYIEAVLKGYNMPQVDRNDALRASLDNKTHEELIDILKQYPNYKAHNITDFESRARTLRAIEIEDYYAKNGISQRATTGIDSIIFGINVDRETRRARISSRLEKRLNNGLIEEVHALLDSGIQPAQLIYYGLEYKFVTQYLIGELTRDEMHSQLEIAIHQFAKRQMTWFRGMERRGFKINWINGLLPIEQQTTAVLDLLGKK